MKDEKDQEEYIISDNNSIRIMNSQEARDFHGLTIDAEHDREYEDHTSRSYGGGFHYQKGNYNGSRLRFYSISHIPRRGLWNTSLWGTLAVVAIVIFVLFAILPLLFVGIAGGALLYLLYRLLK